MDKLPFIASLILIAAAPLAAQKPSPFPAKNRKYSKAVAASSAAASQRPDEASSANFPGTPANPPAKARAEAPPESFSVIDGGAEEGMGSYFGENANGKRGASGEVIDADQMIGAHARLPMGAWIKVTNLSNNRSVVVRVVDRISPKLAVLVSKRAAEEIDLIRPGTARVRVEVVTKR
ncbi:MAG: septal ring lytic transglycosylase RlpA family protein [Bryobacterales bacterium]|nr:septal ring lytic transglycosylase RlpA family protein [Bryobacterales bacterium]